MPELELAPPALPRIHEASRCKLLRELDAGGSGVIYEGRQIGLNRPVAVKLLRHSVGDEALVAAEISEKTKSDYLALVHDAGDDDEGNGFIVSELLVGRTLEQRIEAEGALSIDDALAVLRGVARGLADIHSLEIVHRDIKPANIYLCRDGTVKVVDFGLAARIGHNQVAGCTMRYAAPEVLRKEPATIPSEVYSLGLTFYEMICGRRAFEDSRSAGAVATQFDAEVWVRSEELPSYIKGVSAALNEAIRELLAIDPSKRPQTIDAAIELLQTAHEQAALSTRVRSLSLWGGVALLVIGGADG